MHDAVVFQILFQFAELFEHEGNKGLLYLLVQFAHLRVQKDPVIGVERTTCAFARWRMVPAYREIRPKEEVAWSCCHWGCLDLVVSARPSYRRSKSRANSIVLKLVKN